MAKKLQIAIKNIYCVKKLMKPSKLSQAHLATTSNNPLFSIAESITSPHIPHPFYPVIKRASTVKMGPSKTN